MDIVVDWRNVLPPISIKAETIFTIGGFGFTNSMLFTLLVIAGLTLFYAFAMRKRSLVPTGAQNLAEGLVELLLGLVEGTAGRRVGRRISPLIATLFLFIIVANWSGLIPGVGTIGGCYTVTEASGQQTSAIVKTASPDLQEQTQGSAFPTPNCGPGKEFRPFLRPANADLNTTLAMAIIAVVVVQVAGVAAHGVGGYVKELTTPIFLA